MTVRRLRAKQRGPFCSWCKERATHRGVGFTRFACVEHLAELEKADTDQSRLDQHETEGEFTAGVPR
jgi:hypothetical protein